MKIPALIIFLCVYGIMIGKPGLRVKAAVCGALLFLLTGIEPVRVLPESLNFNVLLMISGMMITVFYFIESKMPMRIADFLLDKSKNLCMVTIYLSLFAGVISAFVDNVATVLMIAPVGIAIAKKKNISPVPMIISIAVSSNLQGAATLVGDTTSILLGQYAHMTFMDFFSMNGRPGIFWAVELGALATVPVMLILFRNMKAPVQADEKTKVENYFPTVMLIMTIVVLIIASFFKNRPALTNGCVCMLFAISCMVHSAIRTGSQVLNRSCMKEMDWETLLLLASLFIVVDGITQVGLIDDIAAMIAKAGGKNYFLLYTIIVWFSVFISAFVDNIPYVTAMLPVIAGTAKILNISPNLLFYGLLTGATLGGNLTPIGASANITGIGILKNHGYDVSSKEFMKISVPFTLTAVTVGYVFLWIFWK